MSSFRDQGNSMEMSGQPVHRLRTHDLELGTTDAVAQHQQRHVVESRPVSQRRLNFEHSRPRWVREFLAEATGVFIYV
jgi:hypothetical protein